MTIQQDIADWVIGDCIESLPAAGVQLAKRAFVDTLGVTLLGARLEAPRIVAATECGAGGRSGASVVAMRIKTDVRSAALINGTSAHADLFDDNSAPMIAHPSAPLVSALLPLAQSRGASGHSLLQSYAVGFEVGVKLGRMLNPQLYERGWHATRVIGVLGGTAACCRLIGLDGSRTAAALGIATSMASGIRQNFGTMTMALHAGLTARDAVHAALLAERGFGADPSALEGRYGFFALFAGLAPALLPLGDPFELVASGIIFKPYPSGAPTHAAVDAALALRERIGGDTSRVAKVVCFVHPWNAMTLREEPPRDMLQAKVNLRYCVAAALHFGKLGYGQFEGESLHDSRLRELMTSIDVRTADDLPDNGEFPAEVEIEMVDGRKHRQRCEVPPGGSTRPLTDAQVAAKFRDCAAVALDATAAERALSMIGELETLPNVAELCELLEGSSAPARTSTAEGIA